ncbi:hypothetical protein HOA91_06200 [Candidatus Woesearchaeota archaeon]|jgi:hypothetical protein|nr:hypothetical protein [Candidatus Woesearchaeota archaeon]
MVKRMYTHIKVQDALEVMEARNKSLSFREEELYGRIEGKKIVSDKVGTDYMTNQPIYKTGAEEWNVMDLYHKYKSMEPDAEERKYNAMVEVVLKQQKQQEQR